MISNELKKRAETAMFEALKKGEKQGYFLYGLGLVSVEELPRKLLWTGVVKEQCYFVYASSNIIIPDH
jgi:hypothetical protein